MDQTRSVPALATAYGLSRPGLQRHLANHLKVSLQALAESNNLLTIVKFATSLYDRCVSLADRIELMLDTEGMTPRSAQAAASSLREIRQAIELLSRLVTSETDHSEDEARNDRLDAALWLQVERMSMPELPPGGGIDDADIIDPEA